MLRRLAAVGTGAASLLCLLVLVGVGKFIVDHGGDVVWLEIGPVALGLWLVLLALVATTVRLARRPAETPPRRFPMAALMLGALLLGQLALVASQARLLLVGEHTSGTVVGTVVSSSGRRGTSERPRVEFTHADGRTRGFLASNPLGSPVLVGESFDVVYDPEACAVEDCPEDDAVSSPTRLRFTLILSGCIAIALGAGMGVSIVRSRRAQGRHIVSEKFAR